MGIIRSSMKSKGHKILSSIVQLIIAVVVALLVVGIIQQIFFMPIGVKGISMLPTFQEKGDVVYLQKKSYTINRNDIIVLYRPKNDEVTSMNPAQKGFSLNEFFYNFFNFKKSDDSDTSTGDFICVIKRVIGMPGDKIEIKDAVLYINDEEVKDFPMKKKMGPIGVGDGVWEIAEDEYFVLGDNRNYSHDSEDYGPIKKDWILGKALLVYSNGKIHKVK